MPKDARQAARWLRLAAEKAHAPSQALLGHLLFNGADGIARQRARGLMFLTLARESALDTASLGSATQAIEIASATAGAAKYEAVLRGAKMLRASAINISAGSTPIAICILLTKPRPIRTPAAMLRPNLPTRQLANHRAIPMTSPCSPGRR